MKHKELSALVVKNLKDFDAAARLMEQEIEPIISDCFSEIVDKWARSHGWEPNILKKIDTYDISLPGWKTEPSAWKATIRYCEQDSIIDSIEGESYFLAKLCGIGGWCGFELHVEAAKTKLKQVSQTYIRPMSSQGLEFSDQTSKFCSPVRLTTEQIAESIKNNTLEEIIEPAISEVLDKFNASKDLLIRLVDDATL